MPKQMRVFYANFEDYTEWVLFYFRQLSDQHSLIFEPTREEMAVCWEQDIPAAIVAIRLFTDTLHEILS